MSVQVPPFRGLEPRLGLGYSSEGRNGFVGAGCGLGGFSTVQRVGAGLGTPKFDATDTYTLDGQEVVPCVGGSVSPSCTSGGTHSTKIENYLKIKLDSALNQWHVWSKDGTKTVFTSILTVTGGTLRWGQMRDTMGAWLEKSGQRWKTRAGMFLALLGYGGIVFSLIRPQWAGFGLSLAVVLLSAEIILPMLVRCSVCGLQMETSSAARSLPRGRRIIWMESLDSCPLCNDDGWATAASRALWASSGIEAEKPYWSRKRVAIAALLCVALLAAGVLIGARFRVESGGVLSWW